MMKKIIVMLIAVTLLVGICASTTATATEVDPATQLKTTLEVVEKSSGTKYLENEQGYISQTIVDSNADTGEVTIELKLENTKKKQEVSDNVQSNGNNSEIYLIIDESGSMWTDLADGRNRREAVRGASKVLAKTILDNYDDVKVGVIKFADEAVMTSELTDNIEQINTAIDTYTGGGTHLYDALALAKNSYSQGDINKLAIILTDGAPNGASVSTDSEGNDISVDDITKQELINLNNSGVSVITMMTELEDESSAEEVFGTPEAPTAGKYYYIADADIDEVIKNNIYSDVVDKIEVINPEITTVKIVDYFPQEITDNFEFSYVGDPSVGTVSEAIDEETRTITWGIETLNGNEAATLQYKLKIKDMQNADLVDKTIATSEKVVLTYTDSESKDYTLELTSSPKIRLSVVDEEPEQPTQEPTEESTQEPTEEPTVKPTVKPTEQAVQNAQPSKDNTVIKTGESAQTVIIASIVMSLMAVVIISIMIDKKRNSCEDIK